MKHSISDVCQKFKCELGVLSRAVGSAVLSQGNTIMLAAVYGPNDSKIQHLQVDKAFVEAHYRPKNGIPGVAERLRESMLRNTCETILMTHLFPRTTISVIVQEIQDSGEVLGCAINAACLALVHAGIDMKCMVAAVTCAVDSVGNLLVEPHGIELSKAQATGTFVFENVDLKLVTAHTKGTFTLDQYKEATQKCRAVSGQIFNFYRDVFLRKKSSRA